jgi:hypothetical protein
MRRNALSLHPAPSFAPTTETTRIVKFTGLLWRFALGCAVVLACASTIAGCAGGSAYGAFASNGGGGGGTTDCVTAIPPAGTEIIGVNLTNPTQAACNDTTYSFVKAYFGGGVITTSQVISVTHSTSILQFTNLDVQPHTAASLGPWSGSYPSSGPSASATPSPKNTDISVAGFTTGNLDPGATSKNYIADVPGIYVIGCAYHYTSDSMRTVIIVQ